MAVERLSPDHDRWTAFVAHLERANMTRWVIGEDGQPGESLFFLATVEEDCVVGHISLRHQPITSPATDWSGGKETPITGPDGDILHELFVYTFAVDEDRRRRGYGRALQLAALELARQTGCYQVRSWSSLDKPANHALKISLGFAIHPAIYLTESGLAVSGVYFIKAMSG